MENDWPISVLPSPSTTSNLKAKLPPDSPFLWLYSTWPVKKGQEDQDSLLVLSGLISEVADGNLIGIHINESINTFLTLTLL